MSYKEFGIRSKEDYINKGPLISWLLAGAWAFWLSGDLQMQATALRLIDSLIDSEPRFTVSVEVSPPSDVFAYALEEKVPAGWTVEDISQNGLFDPINSMIKWGPYFDNESREFRYYLKPPDGFEGSERIAGTVSYDGNGGEVEGSSLIEVSGEFPIRIPVKPTPKIEKVGERSLPERVDSGVSFQVVIGATPPEGGAVYAVEEKLPVGLILSQIGEGGGYDASSGRIKWGPFF